MVVSKDSKKIEQDGVNAVSKCFRNVNHISADIAENDKTLCIDGCLRLYSSNTMSVDTLIGEIEVQVKGTTSKRESDSPKKKVRIRDLKYYLKHGGVLYFVVYEGERNDEVFFRELLPFDIKRILSNHESQKSVTLRFRPFPNDCDKILQLVTQAIKDKETQQLSTDITYCSLEEYETNGFNFPEHTFTINVGQDESIASLAPYKNGIYIYGKDSCDRQFPIDKIENIQKITIGTELIVSAGDVTFETEFSLGEDKTDGLFYRFDDFEIDIKNRTIRLDEKSPLSIRLRDLHLFRELKANGSLWVNGDKIISAFSPDERSENDELDKRIEVLEQIDAVMKRLHVKKDLDLETLTNQNLRDLRNIYQGIIEGKLFHRPNMQLAMSLIKMPGFSIKFILFNNGEDNFSLVDMLDVDTAQIVPYLADEEKRSFAPIPPLLIQTKEELRELGNIDAALFERSCELIPINEKSSHFANEKMLEMINAADVGAICSTELLNCCRILVGYLEPFCSTEVTMINRLQIKARLEKLDNEDDITLAKLIASSDNLPIEACASILRGDSVQTQAIISKMTPDEQNSLHSWPVWHLMHKEFN